MTENLYEQFAKVTRLTIKDRKHAYNTTMSSIRAKLGQEPQEKQFRPNTQDWISIAQSMLPYIALLFIGCIALYISGGKQLKAAYEIFEPMVKSSQNNDYITESYARNSSVAILAFGEIACVFFMAMASVLPASIVRFREYEFNFYGVACYIWAFVCASIAIVANLSVSSGDHSADLNFLAAILKIVPPATALFIGWTFERLIIQWQKKTKQWRDEFKQAHDNWVKWSRNLELHPDYEMTLQNNLLQALYGYDGNYELLEDNKRLKELAYSVELEAMQERLNRVNVTDLLANPTQQP